MIPCAIYIRKSREEKDKPSHRLQVQREQLPAHARVQGWKIEIYDDGHASAARGKVEDLRERSRLEADIRAGKINIILTIELSRLSRDDSLQDYVGWLHLCSERHVRLATPSRILDPSQHSDWMLLLMEGGFSSVEMKVLRSRMKEGHDQAFHNGKFLGGTPPAPYIYDHAACRPVIDPEQLPRMQKLWQLAETTSASKISDILHMPEIAVRRAISDDRLNFYQAKRIDPATMEIILCDWEPCLGAEQAMLIRAGRRSRKNRTGKKAPYGGLLSNLGILYCGYCGRTAKIWQNSKIKANGVRIDYYGCQSKGSRHKCDHSRLMQQRIVDNLIIDLLCDTLANLDDLKTYWQQELAASDTAGEYADILRQIQTEETRKKRLISAIADGLVEFSDARPQMTEINNRLDYLGKQRHGLAAPVESPEWDAMQISRDEFTGLSPDVQRTIFQLAIQKISLHYQNLEVLFNFPIHSSGSHLASAPYPQKQKAL